MRKLAIITTHPIQYYAPVFRLLSERKQIDIKVFYTLGQTIGEKYDHGFKQQIDWDIPLLDGYAYEAVRNISTKPGSHHTKGIINPDLIKQIKQWQADTVLVFGWAYESHLQAIRYFKNKIPVYFRGDSTLLDKQNPIKTLLRKLRLRWLYQHVDHAFYVGTNNKAYFKYCGLRDDQLSFAPHAIDNDRFGQDRDAEVGQLRKNLGIGENDLLILFAGKFEAKKDPMLLLDVFLAMNKPDIHLLFVGSGILEIELLNKAAKYKSIHFMPFQNQSYIPVVYQACDLFCLPSEGPGETWGLAVNEAMACGKAVLVSDKCGCAVDLVTPDNGKTFAAGNKSELTLSLEMLTRSKEKLAGLGRASKKLIAPWNFEHIAAAIENKLIHETK